MPANSKASQLLNGFGNFMNGVSNAARDVVANPIADIANVGLKTNPYVAAANLVTKGKVNKAIDTVTSAAKGEQPNSLQKQPNDPTSIAQAAGEGLVRGVDAAAAVVSLTDLARQLPKAAQAGWKIILNKVNKAKTPKQQQALAQEARDYVTKHIEINDNLSKRMYNQSAEVPAYQQRAFAKDNPGMARYKTNAAEVNFAETKGGDTSTPLHPMTSYDNSLKQKLTPEMASQLRVPYRKWSYVDTKKITGKNFAKQRAAADKSAQAAGIEDYDTANAIANYIQEDIKTSPEKYVGSPINIRNGKYTAKDFIRDSRNANKKTTQPISRAERNAADMNAAEIEKKKIMDQYGISSKDYDEYANAAANTYIYIDKNGNPVNQMAGAGWPSGGSYFIDEKAEVMPYLKGYARRHPTVDEYIRMAEEEAELGRLAEAEAEDIAREAGPAYDWSL